MREHIGVGRTQSSRHGHLRGGRRGDNVTGAPLDGGPVTEGGRQLALPFYLFLEAPNNRTHLEARRHSTTGNAVGYQWKLTRKGHLQDRDRETLGARDPSLQKSQTLQELLGTARAVANTRSI